MENARRQITDAAKPLLVHCNVGFTAAVAVMVTIAKQENIPASEGKNVTFCFKKKETGFP